MNRGLFVKIITLNLFTSANCMIVQLCLSVSLSYIFSNSIFIFSLFTGLYLMSMGLGVLLIERIRLSGDQWVRLALGNSCLGVILANPGIIAVLLLNEWLYFMLRSHQIDALFLMFPIGIVFTVLIGIVSGAELPILSKLIEEEKWHVARPIIGVLTSDYFGAFLGTMIFAFILYPFAGLIQTIFIAQIVTLACIMVVFFSLASVPKRRVPVTSLCLLNVYVLGMFFYQDRLLSFLDAISGF